MLVELPLGDAASAALMESTANCLSKLAGSPSKTGKGNYRLIPDEDA